MVKLIILVLLVLLTFTNGFNKVGIKYKFNKERIVKKFYFDPLTHKLGNISDRILKSKTLYFNPSNFTLIPSLTSIKSSTLFFIDPRAKSRSANKDPIYHIGAKFSTAKFMFVDIRAKNGYIELPYWTRSIDFWMLTSVPNVKIGIYFKYPDGTRKKSVVNVPHKSWQKRFMNLYASFDNKASKAIKITKIRISKPVDIPPSGFSVLISPIQVYSHLRSLTNQYYTTYKSFANFEEGKYSNWGYVINNTIIKQKISKLKKHNKSWYNNRYYLSLDIPVSIHKRKEVFIYLPFVMLKKGHQISIWIKGDNSGQEISAIFQDGKRKYFELVLTEVHFSGWKKVTVKIPDNQISYFNNSLNLNPYIFLAGLKLSPIDKKIELGLDQLEGVIKPSLVL